MRIRVRGSAGARGDPPPALFVVNDRCVYQSEGHIRLWWKDSG